MSTSHPQYFEQKSLNTYHYVIDGKTIANKIREDYKNTVDGISVYTNFLPLARPNIIGVLPPNTTIPDDLCIIQKAPYLPPITYYGNYYRIITNISETTIDSFHQRIMNKNDGFCKINWNKDVDDNGGLWENVYRIPNNLNNGFWIDPIQQKEYNQKIEKNYLNDLESLPMLRINDNSINLMMTIYKTNRSFAKALWKIHKDELLNITDDQLARDAVKTLTNLMESADDDVPLSDKRPHDMLLIGDVLKSVPHGDKPYSFGKIPRIPLPLLPGSFGRAFYFKFRKMEEKLAAMNDENERFILETQMCELYEFMKNQHEILRLQHTLSEIHPIKMRKFWLNTEAKSIIKSLPFYIPKRSLSELPTLPTGCIPELPIKNNRGKHEMEFYPTYLSPIAMEGIQDYLTALDESEEQMFDFFGYWEDRLGDLDVDENTKKQFEDDLDDLVTLANEHYREGYDTPLCGIDWHFSDVGLRIGIDEGEADYTVKHAVINYVMDGETHFKEVTHEPPNSKYES